MKTYLGDSIYAEYTGYSIVLTTENGTSPPSNIIILEEEVIEAFLNMLKQIALAGEGEKNEP